MAKKTKRITDGEYKLGILLLSFTTVFATVFNFATSQGYLAGELGNIFGMVFMGIAILILGVIAWAILK